MNNKSISAKHPPPARTWQPSRPSTSEGRNPSRSGATAAAQADDLGLLRKPSLLGGIAPRWGGEPCS